MAYCPINEETTLKIQGDMTDVMLEAGLNGLSPSDVKIKFKNLFLSFKDYSPREELLAIIKQFANDYGLFQEPSMFFENIDIIDGIIDLETNPVQEENNTTDKILYEEAARNALAKDVKKEFLDKAYGSATDVKNKVQKDASIALANAILINRLQGRTVSSVQELNNNVRTYQEKLFSKIVSYLKEYYQNAPGYNIDLTQFDGVKMYRMGENGKIEYTGAVEALEPQIMQVLSRDHFHDDHLNALFAADESSIEHRRLEAYNAWQLLSHFDSLIKIKYGKSIEIADFGDMKFSGEDRYRRSDKGANNKTSWRTTDEINLNEEVDNVIQELINSTPLLSYGTENQLSYMQFTNFTDILSKIKEAVYQGEDLTLDENFYKSLGLSQNTLRTLERTSRVIVDEDGMRTKVVSLKSLINKIRQNPQKYLSTIFELLSNNDVYKRAYENGIFEGFQQQDKDIIYSIHKGITGSSEITNLGIDELGEPVRYHSINFICAQDPSNSIYPELAQAADSIFKINFLQYYKGLDGEIKVRNMSNTRLDGILRDIRNTLKTRNNKKVPGICTNIHDGYATIRGIDIRPYTATVNGTEKVLDAIEFKIPNTEISARIDIKSGAVTFKKDGNRHNLAQSDPEFEDVMKFISDVTGQNVTEELINLSRGNTQFNTELKAFTELACRSLMNSYLSNVYLEGLTSKPKIIAKLKTLMENPPKVDMNMQEIDLIHNKDINTLEDLANGLAIQQGLLSSSQVKTGNGNSQSAQSLSRLLGGVQSQMELQNRLEGSATKDCLILDTTVLKGIYTAKEYYDLEQSKEHTDFNVNEFATSMFLEDFIGGLMNDDSYGAMIGNGIVSLIPSVNSDKNTIGRILIDTNKEVRTPAGMKRIRDLNEEEFEGVIANELGGIYGKVINQVEKDFVAVLGGHELAYTQASFDAFNEKHKIIDPNTGTWNGKYDSVRALNAFVKEYNSKHRNAPISLTDQIHFIANKDGSIKPNAVLMNYRDEFIIEPRVEGTLSTFHKFMQHKSADIIGSLLRAGFKVDLTNDSKTTKWLLDPKNLDSSWVDLKHGQMIIGKFQLFGQIFNIRNQNDLERIAKEVRSRIAGPTGSLSKQLVELSKVPSVGNYENYLQNPKVYQKQIADLEKNDENVKKYVKLKKQIETIQNADLLYNPQLLTEIEGCHLELNPLIKQYNMIDYLFTQEFMISTVGTLAAHPVKGEVNNVEEEEAGRYQALHKRNVSYTATMQEFTLGMLRGIPSDYNIAIVDDIKDLQYNVTGSEDTVKPFDGATFVNPFIVYLENESLGAAKAGITKKQFVHFYDEKTANGGIIKTCGFGLTNDWMRNSPLLQRMMWKMTSGTWIDANGNEILDLDITRDYFGNNIDYGDVYFKKNGHYYHITGIQYLGNNRYNIDGTEVRCTTRPGQLLADVVEEVPIDDMNTILGGDPQNGILVNSNYTLWQMFGGKDSLEFSKGKLIPSEKSIKNVVLAMNNVGTNNDGSALTIEDAMNVRTQDDIFQVLKHSDIHYAATAGAVKQGAANINTNSTYHDDEPYNFMKIHMNQAGIQLDKEHHADGSELSLMTQVINACAHRGYSLDDSMEMFGALRTLTDVGTSELLKPLEDYIKLNDEASRKAVVEATVNTILKILSRQSMNESDLLSVLTQDLIEEIKKGVTLKEQDFLTKLPIDNPAIYAKFMSTVSVFLTTSGIKMKIPGILSVLTPSYNIMLIFEVPVIGEDGKITWHNMKWEQISNNSDGLSPEEYLEKMQQYAPSVFGIETNENGLNTPTYHWENLQLGKTYRVTDIDGNIKQIKVGTVRQYKAMKEAIKSGKYQSILKDITKGRELGNYDVNFKGTPTGGVESDFSLYDLDSVTALYDIPDIFDLKSAPKYKQGDSDFLGYKIIYGPIEIKGGRPVGMRNEHNGTIRIDLQAMQQKFIEKAWLNPLRSEPINANFESVDELLQFSILHEYAHNYIRPNKGESNYDYETRVNNEALNVLNGGLLQFKKYRITEIANNFGITIPEINLLDYEAYGNKVAKELRKIVRRDTAILSPNGEQFFEGNSVKINGVDVVVNKSTIKTQAYELVLPKIFINEFGLDTNDQLDEIEHNPDFFLERLIKNLNVKVDNRDYDIALLNASRNKEGKTVQYYLSEGLTNDSKERLAEVNLDGYKLRENGKLYRIDAEGNQIYELSSDSDKIYIDYNGNEIIVTDDPQFYIDHLKYATIKISEEVDDDTFQEYIDTIGESSNRSAKKWYRYINSLNGDVNDLKTDITLQTTLDLIDLNKSLNIKSMRSLNDEISSSIDINSDNPVITMLRELAHEMHSSFMQSLEVVASRTPSQSMQSFMPMRIVAFDNPNVNTAFVSTALIWLLGSDYDVDAVSVAAYEIGNDGRMELWSNYADLSTVLKLKESMTLPFPTGKSVVVKEIDPNASIDEQNSFNIEAKRQISSIMRKYKSLFRFAPNKDGNVILKLVNDPKNNQPNLILLGQFITEVGQMELNKLSDEDNKEILKKSGITLSKKDNFNITEGIARLVNNHNQYLSKVNLKTLTAIAKNYSMYKMYKVIDTPWNLIQAQSSVDAMTGPLKKIGDAQPVSQLISVRTPGNVFDKAESIEDNQVGKDGISICAVGMKSFFGLTAYENLVANYGTEEDLKKLRLDHGGIKIYVPGKGYVTRDYMANVNPKLNSRMYELLSKLNDEDSDAALALSALLSLATDNAKELQLSKLNAGTKTIGMYIYGASIGMEFNDIAKIMTSKIGWLITNLTKSNVFTGERGIFSIDKVFDYLETGPKDIMNNFDEVIKISDHLIARSPVQHIAAVLAESKYDKTLDPNKLFCKFAWEVTNDDPDIDLQNKIDKLEKLKATYYYASTHGSLIKSKVSEVDRQRYCQAVEALEEYVRQVNTVKRDILTYESMLTLAAGGEEFRVLGRIFGLNQGLKTKPEETILRVFDIQNVISSRAKANANNSYRKDYLAALLQGKQLPKKPQGKTLEMFDLAKFCFDEEYRKDIIEQYDGVKHTVNILDAVASVPHFFGYLRTLATDYEIAKSTSRKFTAMTEVGKDLINSLGASSSKDKQQIFKGVGNYYSDYVRKAWMLDTLPPITIPKGVKFIQGGKIVDTGGEIRLGTIEGDAAFKYIMENEVIPNLKAGKLGRNESPNKLISDNLFIKGLTTALLTSTVTHNPIIYYTLPINMLPSTDEEKAVFNSYKSEFNKLQGISFSDPYCYNFDGTTVPVIDLLYYYGLIAHYGKQGRQSIMPIFENIHQSGNFKLRSFHAYESQFDEDISPDLDTILPYVLKTLSPYSAYTEMIYAQDPDTMITELWHKVKRSDYKEDIEELAEREEISNDVAWYRILKDSGIINGYRRITNPTLRNPELSNYFMITEEDSIDENEIDPKDVKNYKTGTITTQHGDIEITVFGNVQLKEDSVTVTLIKGEYSDLLVKYPILRKAPLRVVECNGVKQKCIDKEAYAKLLDEALSVEHNECGNLPY